MERLPRRRSVCAGSWFSRVGAAVSCGALLLAFLPVPASRAVLHGLYPQARVRVDGSANAVVVVASPRDLDAMRKEKTCERTA